MKRIMEYANNLKGTALAACDGWCDAHSLLSRMGEKEGPSEAREFIRGKLCAYGFILHQITGRTICGHIAEVRAVIDAM